MRQKDFEPDGALRLWEYGVGDTVRKITFVSVRRVKPGAYQIVGDVDLTLTLGGKTRKVTAQELAKAGGAIRWETGK